MQRPHIRRSNCNLIRIAHRNNAVCIINIAYIVCINDSTAGTLQEVPYIGSLQKLLQGNISHRIFPTIIQTDLHRPVRCQYMTDLGTLDRVYHILVLDIQHSCLYFILPQHRTCVRTRAPEFLQSLYKCFTQPMFERQSINYRKTTQLPITITIRIFHVRYQYHRRIPITLQPARGLHKPVCIYNILVIHLQW